MKQSPAGRIRVAICVPARNEADALPRLFAALDRLDRYGLDPVICLLLDSCDDRSAAVAHDYAARASLPIRIDYATQAEPNAGRARHGAMLLGERALDGRGLLLTTDADSLPAVDWLQAMVAALGQVDVVAGKVVRTVTWPNPAQDRLEQYYESLYAMRRVLDPVVWEAAAAHHQTSGANLGISVHHYRILGGFPPIPAGEDAQLVDDASRAGLRVRRDAASVVYTSDRRTGRVVHGFAGGLRVLDRDGDAVMVAHPEDAAWQYRGHALARRVYDDGDVSPLADAIGLTCDHLVGVLRDSPNAEAFAMRVVPVPPGGMRRVTLAVAEAGLATLSAGRFAA
ncbi:glycosyltransferase [Sphingomonas sp. MA1305]|uniref:glycosyltransferase n=1 Tax=Sphingomonas sp. MA1305 TaxID=2479204 RepID=UPI0018DFC316|nr:glycosyltransferase [Sphingomonas sp. MA1305]MBI0476681.1 glycosyltransferase [Sphingomonas sp. MA1305]